MGLPKSDPRPMTAWARLADELLSFLELREAEVLAWGFYGPTFSPADVETALEREAPPELLEAWSRWASEAGGGTGVDAALEQMASQGLLFRLDSGGFRTRFGETVRLLAHLKQRFSDKDWATAPRLVSDVKLHLNRRRYPKRSVNADAAWKTIEASATNSELQRALFYALAALPDRQLDFAGFQTRAFERVMAQYAAPRSHPTATVVTAGTGSGKTKAFYVPAFLSIAAEVARDARSFTKIIAVYPRNVLLEDQLREALSELQKINVEMRRRGSRPLTIGALTGDTPWEEQFLPHRLGGLAFEQYKRSRWKRSGAACIVPLVRSPSDGSSDLLWRDEDRLAGRVALYRKGEADPDVPTDTLVITRDQITSTPPDVLFVSVEMLNRELSNPQFNRVFGIGQHSAPRLLLLDEAHSFAGATGAQSAWVIRRWMHWARARNLHAVALSATLKDAPAHIAAILGISPNDVVEHRPLEHEFESEGMEYNAALKGDALSGASLLATTIQSAMVLARTLTPRTRPQGGNYLGSAFYGTKIFGFTDNLDSVNRWLGNLKDADGAKRLSQFRLDPAFRNPATHLPQSVRRRIDEEGQWWELCRRLGFDLNGVLSISRTSSQDPGVEAASDIVVATSSLEVGFDDPNVGAMLHHKSPRSMSSFIQRKGRAGRRRGVRPWTVVVLSDYGADRAAFHRAERLFQPEIDDIVLPMANPFVRRVQATYFLLDWLGQNVRQGSVYKSLKASGKAFPGFAATRHGAQKALADFIGQGSAWERFQKQLRILFRARSNEPADAESFHALLWEPPKALLRHAVPTLLRQLEHRWRVAGDPAEREDGTADRPLAHFLPKATFESLDVAEVSLRVQRVPRQPPDVERVSVSRAFQEAAPGHVSKRFEPREREPGLWMSASDKLVEAVPPPLIARQEAWPESLWVGNVGGIQVYQPQAVDLCPRPRKVLDTSSGAWKWESHVDWVGEARETVGWSSRAFAAAFKPLTTHLQRDFAAARIIRFTRECRYEIGFDPRLTGNRQPQLGVIRVGPSSEGAAEGVGYAQEVDALSIEVRPEYLTGLTSLPDAVVDSLRADYFRHRVLQDSRLTALVNPFLAEWLCQTSIAMLTATALTKREPIPQARNRLSGLRAGAARKVLESMFEAQDVQTGDAVKARVRDRVLAAWQNPVISQCVEEAEAALFEPPGPDFFDWCRQRHLSSLLHAFKAAATMLVPSLSEDDIQADVFGREGRVFLVLSETNSGGIGEIEQVADQLDRRWLEFEDAILHRLSRCERDARTANLLGVAAGTAVPGGPIEGAFESVRGATGLVAIGAAKHELRGALAGEGLQSHRASVVSVVSTLLRPGSRPETDRAHRLLNRLWRKWEYKVRLALDPRVVAYVVAHRPAGSRRLTALLARLGGERPNDAQIHSVVQQFLFSSCTHSCRECLDDSHRYYTLAPASRFISSYWLDNEEETIDYGPASGDVLVAKVVRALQRQGRAKLKVPHAQLSGASSFLFQLLATDVSTDHAMVSVSLKRVERLGADWIMDLRFQEGQTFGHA